VDSLPELGEVHEDCRADIERAIKDGGCDPDDYLKVFGAAMGG